MSLLICPFVYEAFRSSFVTQKSARLTHMSASQTTVRNFRETLIILTQMTTTEIQSRNLMNCAYGTNVSRKAIIVHTGFKTLIVLSI
jgi:alkyl hydroperoxide reductase subunit AhpC